MKCSHDGYCVLHILFYLVDYGKSGKMLIDRPAMRNTMTIMFCLAKNTESHNHHHRHQQQLNISLHFYYYSVANSKMLSGGGSQQSTFMIIMVNGEANKIALLYFGFLGMMTIMMIEHFHISSFQG